MPVTGGIKFFEPNFADSKTGATATGSGGGASFILDRNQYTVWRSIGSSDTVTETLTITLSESAAFSRLFLARHNLKDYTVKYWGGASFIDFANVTGVNSATSSVISETTFVFGSSYYEFDAVTTDKIQIKMLKTQIPNQEKFLNSFVATTELGTLAGFPIIKDATKDKKLRKSTLLNGRSLITKSLEVMRFAIDFKNYPAPTPYDADIDLVYNLFDRDDNFLVWLCGGRAGDPYFKYQLRGFRLEDLIEVQTVNVFKDSYRKNYYNGPVRLKLNLEEAG